MARTKQKCMEDVTEQIRYPLSSNAAMVRLDVFGPRSDGPWGICHNMYCKEPLVCTDMADFLFKVDELFDYLVYPMAVMEHRSFSGLALEISGAETQPVAYHDCNKFNLHHWKRQESIGKEIVEFNNGERLPAACFFIHVMYRRNASWQGSVCWVRSGKVEYFRSALELLHLLRSALHETDIR